MRHQKWLGLLLTLLISLSLLLPAAWAGEEGEEEEKDYLAGLHLIYLGADYLAGEGAELAAAVADLEEGSYDVLAAQGNTIAGNNDNSYAALAGALEQYLDSEVKNLLVVELTANDLAGEYSLGDWDYIYDTDYDAATIYGALDTVFQAARNLEMTAAVVIPDVSEVPAAYEALTEAAMDLQQKWGFAIIDLRDMEEESAADVFIAQTRPYLSVMRGNYKNMFKYAGNLPQFDPEYYPTDENSPLKGLTIIQLGSSVTDGSGSDESISFVEDIAQMTGSSYIKESVPGTTMSNYAPLGDTSYIYRMEHNIDPQAQVDLFLCQLSTNDASKRVPVGEVSASDDPADFDLETVAGAAEYIIHYAQDTWNCPIMFYAGTQYSNAAYGDMVEMLLSLQEKYDIGIIDMYHNLSTDIMLYPQYMSPDGIHPTKRGYAEWWAPYMIQEIAAYLQ